jgi:thiol-disulfide isomerase/thioredoxin
LISFPASRQLIGALLVLTAASFVVAEVTEHERRAGTRYEEWRRAGGRNLREYEEALQSRGMSGAAIRKEIAAIQSYLPKVMDRDAGKDRLGVSPSEFQFDAWVNSEPLTLAGLRGKVVLVRWWTDTCPHCAATSPTLRMLDEQYRARGLRIIAAFHPKPQPLDDVQIERVRRAVETRQFTFPVAIDAHWRTLREWWLTGPSRPATSATFVLDKKGVVRFVHPGMEYHENESGSGHEMCERDLGSVRAAIEQLLAE